LFPTVIYGIIVWLIVHVPKRKPNVIPSDCFTVLQLAQLLIPHRVCRGKDENGNSWTRKSIEDTIRKLVSDTYGVKSKKIELSTRFSEL
jgi:hypothetical protein